MLGAGTILLFTLRFFFSGVAVSSLLYLIIKRFYSEDVGDMSEADFRNAILWIGGLFGLLVASVPYIPYLSFFVLTALLHLLFYPRMSWGHAIGLAFVVSTIVMVIIFFFSASMYVGGFVR
jgi:hypothetical protein